ncbi:ZIP family metal transporter [Acidaminococcus fermentans]|uniref:ZIP family metal transporter n=1 Tax=Acidaminococcus fermentans TaxID=905 RepID=UPI00241D4E0C|nr:ZIP family metal transporter [Acidaminococcus fermentans]
MISADVWKGILIPFLGTSLGAGCVYFMKEQLHRNVQRGLTGFAAGVMVAASIWSLLIPALEESAALGHFAFVPAVVGFWAGILFLLLLDVAIPHLHMNTDEPEGPRSHLGRTTMMLLAVTLHNIPEGMAVGMIYAGFVTDPGSISLGSAIALSLGIAIQNFPEGAIISLPLKAGGMGRHKAFLGGVLSGAVEPIAAAGAILASRIIGHLLPYFLSFAAGAMLYVVVEEMIPEMSEGEHSNVGVLTFALGFTVMMTLDVALG